MSEGNNADLNIILRLIDQATGELKKALGDVKKETEGVNKEGDKASKTLAGGFKEANSQLRDFRRMMSVASFAIGTIILTTREWGFRNKETAHSLTQIGDDIKDVAGAIGSIFAPAIQGMAQGLNFVKPAIEVATKKIRELFKVLNYVSPVAAPATFIYSYWVAIAAGERPIEAWKTAMNVAAASAQALNQAIDATSIENYCTAAKSAEDATTKLFQTWQAWSNNDTQNTMIWATQNQAILSQDIASKQAYYTTVSQLDMLSSNTILQNDLRVTAQKKQSLDDLTKRATMTTRQQMQTVVSAMGQLESALAGASVMGEEWAKAAAAVSLSMAIVYTAQGISLAYATNPWPWSLVVAGIIAAAGAIQVATIASTKFAGGTDSVPAMLTEGEMVLPRTISSAIRQGDIAISGRGGFGAFSGGSAQTTITNYIDIKIDRPTVRSEYDLNTLTEEVSRRVALEVERIR